MIKAMSLSAILLTSQAIADNEMYVGLDILSSSNTLTVDVNGVGSADVDDDSKAFKLKLGTVTNDGWRVQGYFLRETYDIAVFDADNDVLNEIGVDIIKGFEVTPEFSPFIQAGLGYGWMKIDNYTESSISEVNIKLGAGVMYKMIPEFEIIAGVDFQAKAWQDIEALGYTISTTENSTKLYFGGNFHF